MRVWTRVVRFLDSIGVHDRQDPDRSGGWTPIHGSAPVVKYPLQRVAAMAFGADRRTGVRTLRRDRARAEVTISQLLEDSTRLDVGKQAFADPENGNDAVSAAANCYLTPQELLSDNGGPFNLARQGSVTSCSG